MQKIFRKNIIIIMTAAILAILAINFFITRYSLESKQLASCRTKIDQIIHTMENNQKELDELMKNLDEDYLTRAKAAAYMIHKNPEIAKDTVELLNLAKLLDVDELHVVNEKGIVESSTIPRHIGLDFHDNKQTQEFLPILNNNSQNNYVIQESQPNAAEGKIMKYVGTARIGKKGIIQVGLKPVRQMEAQARNTYDYIFSIFPTDEDENFFAVDTTNNRIIAHSAEISSWFPSSSFSVDTLNGSDKGKYVTFDKEDTYYIVTQKYGDMLIGISRPSEVFFLELWQNFVITLVYLLFILVCVVLLLNHLVREKVITGIHNILADLSAITNGNLDTEVSTGGNPEFDELSLQINTMVKSILHSSDRLSKIISISGIPLVAFEYEKGTNQVFVTNGLQKLLRIPDSEFSVLCQDGKLFYQKIRNIMKEPIQGENTIFKIAEDCYVRIHLSIEKNSYLGVITDATQHILEKQKMLYENTHDPLTGLCQYKHFKYQAGEILRRIADHTLCACVMLDLDSFKQINDTYGHDSGDRYLKQFATILNQLPKDHTIVCRRSGDEFCIFVFNYETKEQIVQLLSDFWKSLDDHPIMLSDSFVRTILVSGGYACTDDSTTDLETLMQWADEALYNSKRREKGKFTEYHESN